MQSIGNQVQKIRKKRKVSQAKAAKVIEVSQGAYSNRETGSVPFSAEELQALAKLYDVPVEAFYGKELPENTKVMEDDVKYERVDMSPSAISNRFTVVLRRYMADRKISTIREISEKMHVKEQTLSAVTSGHQNISFAILSNAVKHCGFNSNYTLVGTGDYFIRPEAMKGMIAELTANYERATADKDKLIKSYEALLKAKGIKI